MAGLLAACATLVSSVYGGPQLLYALLFGVVMHHLCAGTLFKPGIEFCARNVLRLGVGMLGARITAAQILSLGWATTLIVIGAVFTTLWLGYALAQRLGLSRAEGALSGGSVAICGASAALAISSVLPRTKDSERFTLMVVVSVTVLSTIAMVIYPLIARFWHFTPELAGLFLGGSIHDVAQVVGAGFTINTATGDFATIVKLFRVSMLAVVVVVVSVWFKVEREQAERQSTAGDSLGKVKKQALMPWFLWLFLVLVALNSVGWLATDWVSAASQFSSLCLVVAIAALGLKSSFKQLAQAGWKPITLLLIETVWMAVFVLTAIALQRSNLW